MTIYRFFLILATLVASVCATSAATLVEDFESSSGYSVGQSLGTYPGWSVYSGSALISNESAFSGFQSVKLLAANPETSLGRDLTSNSGSIGFAELYVRPVAVGPGSGSFLNVDNSVVFFEKVGSVGFIEALDGDGVGGPGELVPLGPSAFALDGSDRAADWIRLTIRQDLANGLWDLSVNGSLAAINLGLYDAVSSPFLMQVWGDVVTDTYMDDFAYGNENPLGTDADADGILDSYETTYGLNTSVNDRDSDLDGDGLTNIEEFFFGTAANASDTDSDGASDFDEVLTFTDPNTDDGVVYLYESFNYTVGSFAQQAVTGFGFKNDIAPGYATIGADSLSYSPLIGSNNHLLKGNNPWWNESSVKWTFSDAVHDRINLWGSYDNEEMWLSFVMELPADLNNKQLRLKFFWWGDHYGIDIDSATNEAGVFVKHYTGGETYASAGAVTPGSTTLYLCRLNIDRTSGTKKVSLALWTYELGVDELPTEAPTSPEAQLSNIALTTDWGVNELHLEYKTPTTPNQALDPYGIDELRLGSTFVAVAPQTSGTSGGGTTTPDADAPTISPASGSYADSVEVSLSTTTPGATIYYTTDGSTPTTASAAYSAPLTLTADATVKAITIAPGYNDSAITEATYTIIPTASAPEIQPAGGTFTGSVEVTLTTTTPGAAIYYTTDGSAPDATASAYTAPFTLTASSTVKAIAIASGYNDSAVAEATFTITPAVLGEAYVYEPFAYPAGSGTTQTATGQGLTGNIAFNAQDTLTADSLSYDALETSAGQLLKGNNPWWNESYVSLPFADSVKNRLNLTLGNTTDTLWQSVLIHTPANLSGKSLRLSFFGWGDHYGIDLEGTDNHAAVYIKAGSTTHHASTANALKPDTTYLALAQLTLDATSGPKHVTLKLWLYEKDTDPLPTNEQTLSAPHAQLIDIPLVTDWGIFQYQLTYTTPAAPNQSLDPYAVDELRLGGTMGKALPHPGLDSDNGGIPDAVELANGLNPNDPSDDNSYQDNDTLDDAWEIQYFGNIWQYGDSDDPDLDGLINSLEYGYGTNPVSADSDGDTLSDGDEVLIHQTDPLLKDSDYDGMADNEELDYGFDPLSDDAFVDSDNDGYPNLFEIKNGGDPYDSVSLPAPSITVSVGSQTYYPGAGGNQLGFAALLFANVNVPQQYSSIQAAISAVASDGAIIEVEPGIYNEVLNVTTGYRFMLKSTEGAKATAIRISQKGSWDPSIIASDCLIDGFEFIGERPDGGCILEISSFASIIRNSVFSGFQSQEDSERSPALCLSGDSPLFENCIFIDNIIELIPFLYIWSVNATFVHCTFYNNYDIEELQDGSGIAAIRIYPSFIDPSSPYYEPHGVTMINSIMWNNALDREIMGDLSDSNFYNCIIRGGLASGTGILNVNPELTRNGFLTESSPAINAGHPDPASLITISNYQTTLSTLDYHGETRPQGALPDIGADEWLDSDIPSDGLPDWFESLIITHSGGGLTDVFPGDNYDNDNGTNFEEYINGTDPTDASDQITKITPASGTFTDYTSVNITPAAGGFTTNGTLPQSGNSGYIAYDGDFLLNSSALIATDGNGPSADIEITEPTVVPKIIAYESFSNYSVNTHLDGRNANGFGFTGTWEDFGNPTIASVQSDGINHPDLIQNSGKLAFGYGSTDLTGSFSPETITAINPEANTTKSTWFSYQADNLTGDLGLSDWNFSLTDSSGAPLVKIDFRIDTGYLTLTSGNDEVLYLHGEQFASQPGDKMLFVGKLTLEAGADGIPARSGLTLWLFNNEESIPADIATEQGYFIPCSNLGSKIEGIRLYNSGPTDFPPTSTYHGIDEIYFGNSYISVAPRLQLNAEISSGTSVQLSWSPVPGVTYQLFRENNGVEELLATQTVVNYVDNELTPGETYSYQLKIVSSSGVVYESTTVEVTINPETIDPISKLSGLTYKLVWGDFADFPSALASFNASSSKREGTTSTLDLHLFMSAMMNTFKAYDQGTLGYTPPAGDTHVTDPAQRDVFYQIDGYIRIDKPGFYEFDIEASDEARLYIVPEADDIDTVSPFLTATSTDRASQYVELEAGLYKIRLQHYQSYGVGQYLYSLISTWVTPDRVFSIIPNTVFFRDFPLLSADSDGDGMDDTWEQQVLNRIQWERIDPDDVSSPYRYASLRSEITTIAHILPEPDVSQSGNGNLDGGTLTNYEEFRYGSDPLELDGDGDGMPDDWEILYGLNPSGWWDENADHDHDHLANIDEYLAGTNPRSFYNGIVPTIQITQQPVEPGIPGGLTHLPIQATIQLGSSNIPGLAVEGAPVRVWIEDALGELTTERSSAASATLGTHRRGTSIVVLADETGHLPDIWLRHPFEYNHQSIIHITAGGEDVAINLSTITQVDRVPDSSTPVELLPISIIDSQYVLTWTYSNASNIEAFVIQREGTNDSWLEVERIAPAIALVNGTNDQYSWSIPTSVIPDTGSPFRILGVGDNFPHTGDPFLSNNGSFPSIDPSLLSNPSGGSSGPGTNTGTGGTNMGGTGNNGSNNDFTPGDNNPDPSDSDPDNSTPGGTPQPPLQPQPNIKLDFVFADPNEDDDNWKFKLSYKTPPDGSSVTAPTPEEALISSGARKELTLDLLKGAELEIELEQNGGGDQFHTDEFEWQFKNEQVIDPGDEWPKPSQYVLEPDPTEPKSKSKQWKEDTNGDGVYESGPPDGGEIWTLFILPDVDIDVVSKSGRLPEDQEESSSISSENIVIVPSDQPDTPGGPPEKDLPLDELFSRGKALKLEPHLWFTPGKQGKLHLKITSGSDKISIYEDANRGTKLSPEHYWETPSETIPETLFLEAIEASDSEQDIEIEFYWEANDIAAESAKDIIKLTVLAVDLKELEFKQDNVVKNDAGTDYGGADWQDNDLDGDVISDAADRRQPVSYKREEQISVAAKWEVAPTGLDVSNWRVRGTGPDGIKIGFDGRGKTVTLAGSTLSMAETTCDAGTKLPNTVKYYSSFEITWELSLDGGATWPCSADKSDNLLYVTYAEPQATMYHTLLHIGSFNADGETDPGTIVTDIWGEFADRNVKKVDPKTGAFVGNAMTYYKTPYDPACPFDVAGLLASEDGRCGAWARLMRDVIKLQGVPNAVWKQIVITPQTGLTPHALWVKNQDLTPLSAVPPSAPTPLSGIPGQGTGDPSASVFVDHAIVTYGSTIYDPSYGQSFSSLTTWQQSALDAISYNGGAVFTVNSGATWPVLVQYGIVEP